MLYTLFKTNEFYYRIYPKILNILVSLNQHFILMYQDIMFLQISFLFIQDNLHEYITLKLVTETNQNFLQD